MRTLSSARGAVAAILALSSLLPSAVRPRALSSGRPPLSLLTHNSTAKFKAGIIATDF